MLGPFAPDSIDHGVVQANRIRVIPNGQTGKWKLITKLSYPPGYSVNDAIDPAHRSLLYTTVERVMQLAMQLGRRAQMSKVDIESAYCLIPIHTQDRTLLGIVWEGMMFIDPMLPFGLHSVPKIFNAVADTIQWHLEQE